MVKTTGFPRSMLPSSTQLTNFPGPERPMLARFLLENSIWDTFAKAVSGRKRMFPNCRGISQKWVKMEQEWTRDFLNKRMRCDLGSASIPNYAQLPVVREYATLPRHIVQASDSRAQSAIDARLLNACIQYLYLSVMFGGLVCVLKELPCATRVAILPWPVP